MEFAKSAIKMKVINNKKSVCDCCGITGEKSLDMFKLKIGDSLFTLCDRCNETLFYKTLHASCYTDGRLKSMDDINIINERKRSQKSSLGQ